MTKNRKQAPQRYVKRVRQETHDFVRELIEEKEVSGNTLASLQSENARLREEVHLYKTELEHQIAQQVEKHDNAECAVTKERFLAIEQRNNTLANLFVAGCQLHYSLERDEVLGAIQEIVINLIGSEDLAIFECEGNALRLVASVGPTGSRTPATISIGEGAIGNVAKTGEKILRDPRNDESPTVCLPLMHGANTIGVLAIFRMLEQKPTLEAIDYELLDLLGAHAGTALLASKLYQANGSSSFAVENVPDQRGEGLRDDRLV